MSPLSVGTSQSKYALKTGEAKLWILLVGINTYEDDNLPSLQYSAKDCQGLSEALAEATQGFPKNKIFIHHDLVAQTPTTETVRSSLQRIISSANPQDTVLFYFSGHGILEPKTQQAILCLKDTQSNDPIGTGLRLEELLQLLDNCLAHQQLIWLDACHSGGMMLRGLTGEIPAKQPDSSLLNPSSQLIEVLQKRASQSINFYALLSCDRYQQFWEFPSLGHGVFTYYLMRGLRGEAADEQGIIDADGLYKYVYHQTLQYIDKTNQQLRLINQQKRSRGETQLLPEYPLQTPKRIVEGVGELILGLKANNVSFPNPRLALIVDGLSCHENTLALSKALRGEGKFELEYWPCPGKSWSEIREAIALCLHSDNNLTTAYHYNQLNTPDIATALLYLRGKIEQTESGEACLVLPDNVIISRWLRQELRRSGMAQQIVILDCPGTNSLNDWVEDLQIASGQGQCIIAAAAPLTEPEKFTQTLLETLVLAEPKVGLSIAGWISQLQLRLAGKGIPLHLFLSGTRGIIEVLPPKVGATNTITKSDLGVCPYMGLKAFTEENAPFFYGRSTLTQQLINSLNHRAFLAVVGVSGSGKSSVVHAGLIAQLRQGKQLPGSEQCWIKSFRPGVNPLQALYSRLVDTIGEKERAAEQMEIEGMLYEGVEGFVRWLRSRSEPMVVLIIDQFKELFTLATEFDRKGFLEIILEALNYAADRFKLVVV